jgi:hypothetical protein
MANPHAKLFPKVLNLPLTVEQYERLARVRSSRAVNVAAFCREAIIRALDRLEETPPPFEVCRTAVGEASR